MAIDGARVDMVGQTGGFFRITMKWIRRSALWVLIVAALATVASGDILEWRDDGGVMHYTNMKCEVPGDRQASMQVLVDEAARRQAAGDTSVQGGPASADPAAPPPDQPSQAQLTEASYAQSLSAYLEGLQRGLDVSGRPPAGGGVVINGPLAVSGSSTVPDYQSTWPSFYGYGWPYFYGYGWPYFYPGVAVSHRGRSPHPGSFHGGARPHMSGARLSFGTSR